MRALYLIFLYLASFAFLAAVPGVSATDSVLEIFGNANMDENIDDADISYVQEIISGNSKPTELADANQDGRIDSSDLDRIGDIIKGEENELTIVDAQGRNVTLNVPIKRAIAINSGSMEIMRAIGTDLKTVLVGVTSYALKDPLYWPELQDKASIVYGSPDYEQIAKLKPDLVILYKKPYKDESFEKFETIDVPVISLNCHDQDTLDSDIIILGELFNKRENAHNLVDWCHDYRMKIQERTADISEDKKLKVMFYSFPDTYYPILKARTGESGVQATLEGAGAINIAEDLNSSSGTADVDSEWVITANPDVIIGCLSAGEAKTGYSTNESAIEYLKNMRDTLLNDSAIKLTNAGKDEKVFIICTDLNRGPMEVAGMAYLAKYFYPDLFEDINPQKILEEYFEDWQGIPYRGTYVYPPLE
jgi:iron complex transport system substrate-binding protein